MRDNRLVFDSISEHFDKWRARYSKELFAYIITACGLDRTKSCLEIGPGSGQASDFDIKTGCDYTDIELGENLAYSMKKKFSLPGRTGGRAVRARPHPIGIENLPGRAFPACAGESFFV